MAFKDALSFCIILLTMLAYFAFSQSGNSPTIEFANGTDSSGGYVTRAWTFVNVSVNDIETPNNITSLIDWNRTLVGWWRFNNESGENDTLARDWSGGGNNGTLTSMNPGLDNCTANCSGWTASGKFGYGMNFDGVNDIVNISNEANFDFERTDSFTLTYWVKPNTSSTTIQVPISKTNDYTPYRGIEIVNNLGWSICSLPGNSAGYIAFVLTNTAWTNVDGIQTSSATKLNDGNWHYYAFTTNGSGTGGMKIYEDGVQLSTTAKCTSLSATILNDYTFAIGGKSDANSQWHEIYKGSLDEVSIHKRVLSPEEINASYNTGLYRLYRNFTGLVETSYTYTAYAQDLAGNVNQTETRTVTIDSITPSLTLNYPAQNGTYYNKVPYFNGTCADTNLDTIITNITQYNISTSSPFNLTNVTFLSSQRYDVGLTCNDTAGNQNSTVFWFTYDAIPPNITFVSPTSPDNTHTISNYTYVNVSISDIPSSGNLTSFIDWNRSLIGWWRFNRESGENDTFVRDWSTYGNNGTINNTNPGLDNCTGNCSGWTISGRFGYGMNFDGKNDHIVLGTPSSLSLQSSLSIEAWIYPTSASGGVIFTHGKQDTTPWAEYQLATLATQKIRFSLNNASATLNNLDSTGNYALRSWTHVAATWNGTTMRLFLNGVEAASPITVKGSIYEVNQISRIGGGTYTSPEYFNGTIDEIRVWNRSLSPVEINASYNTGLYLLYRNFTSLESGNYTYIAYTQDSAGNVNQTETRNFTYSPDIYISISLSSALAGGIVFGSLDTNTENSQSSTCNIMQCNITVSSDTNVNVDVLTKVNAYLTRQGGAETISTEYWNSSASEQPALPATQFSSSYNYTTKVASNAIPGTNSILGFWVTVPSGQSSGNYNNTINFCANQAGSMDC